MGGGSYHSDVSSARLSVGTRRSSRESFAHTEEIRKGSRTKGIHPDLNIKGKVRECCDSDEHPTVTPIVIGMDMTLSRGDDVKSVYEQIPSMLGSIQISDIVPDPAIMAVAIGDGTVDTAPLQVSQWEADQRIDDMLGKIYIEEGGGGTGQESYELAAYYLARKTSIDAVNKRGQKGFMFFTGDEAPYPHVSKAQALKHIGESLEEDVSSEVIFRELQELFYAFLIFPRKTMKERKADIDNEIRKRLTEAGGKFKNVNIRGSLIWNDRNDLDLHCVGPDGHHIFYGDKLAPSGGELDVDRNVGGETTKPVENIRWAKGDAPAGTYKFWVENYRYHEASKGSVPFKVELDIDGTIETFEGETVAGKTGSESRIDVFEFEYNPTTSIEGDDRYDAYDDAVILDQWKRYIPPSNIIRLDDADASVEAMLGAMALQTGRMDLDAFARDMRDRAVPQKKREDVLAGLKGFACEGDFATVDESLFG